MPGNRRQGQRWSWKKHHLSRSAEKRSEIGLHSWSSRSVAVEWGVSRYIGIPTQPNRQEFPPFRVYTPRPSALEHPPLLSPSRLSLSLSLSLACDGMPDPSVGLSLRATRLMPHRSRSPGPANSVLNCERSASRLMDVLRALECAAARAFPQKLLPMLPEFSRDVTIFLELSWMIINARRIYGYFGCTSRGNIFLLRTNSDFINFIVLASKFGRRYSISPQLCNCLLHLCCNILRYSINCNVVKAK